ncbi:thymidylate synthase (FAD) [Nitrosospira sp. Nsp11]|uniref:FAD-dependent thymidylate synthase n=1 Tax=Nitrosospira sp. Nsp11 TaxID=1855338 RepID=UPI00091B75ED|nr:FAD-dependent thymidylate synthase [Nitrosospira sp. Nsp11]SHL40946.1 thymidylate synthase (FAD) [Nitrosospira sp. Nsp11]
MNKLPVLDHGFVLLRNMSGPTRRPDAAFDADDTDPANAARFSFEGQDKDRAREEDLRLDSYLMKNWHTGPFEQVVVWLEMKLPIFVARQFVRHRTARLNEASARYVQLPKEWYIPTLDEVVLQTTDKKQGGRPVDVFNPGEVGKARAFQISLDDACRDSYARYEAAIENGIAMEQARLFLHVNHYTHWIWQCDLHNLMNVLARRDHGHAQGPTQKYAEAVDQLVRKHLPHSMELYDKYRRFAI